MHSSNNNRASQCSAFPRFFNSIFAISIFVSFLTGSAADAGKLLPDFIETKPNPNKRVLNFPKGDSLGEIIVSKDAFFDQNVNNRTPAKGTIVVPAGNYVSFTPARRFYTNPSTLDKFAPDSFDKIEITFISMEDAEDALCNNAIRAIAHFDGLTQLTLDRSDVSDQALASIKNMTKLQSINAFATALSGECFKEFGKLKDVRWVNLQNTGIRDKNVKYFANLPKLRYLSLSHCNISDAGVAGLASNKELEVLDLGENPKITDASIETFKRLPRLRKLIIFQTSITMAGAQKLKGSTLKEIMMPKTLSDNDRAALSKSLPGVSMGAARPKKMNDYAKRMFAPLPK